MKYVLAHMYIEVGGAMYYCLSNRPLLFTSESNSISYSILLIVFCFLYEVDFYLSCNGLSMELKKIASGKSATTILF